MSSEDQQQEGNLFANVLKQKRNITIKKHTTSEANPPEEEEKQPIAQA